MTTEDAAAAGADAIRLERTLPGPVERVWSFITDSDLRATWLAGGPMEPRPGGRYEFTYNHSMITDEPVPERYRRAVTDHRETGLITLWDPPHVLGFTWGELHGDLSHVTIEIWPVADDVKLILTHRRLPPGPEALGAAAAGWHAHLDALAVRLADRFDGPAHDFWTTVDRRTIEYTAAFSAD